MKADNVRKIEVEDESPQEKGLQLVKNVVLILIV